MSASDFADLALFAEHLLSRGATTLAALHDGLERAAVIIERTAKDEIGVYQPATGSFPAWAPLAESTVEDRVSKGYSANEPLLRDGTLRDSISHETKGLEAVIGSTSDIAAYQEFGTETIPPRPFIGPAAFVNKDNIQKLIGAAAVAGLTDGKPITQAMGYDFSTK